MKRKEKTGQILILFSLSLIITSIFLLFNLNNYVIISGTVSSVLFINVLLCAYKNRSDKSIYCSKINKILKTYDSILKKCDTIPDLSTKKITQLTDINYLIDEQNNLKNYIYYIKEENSYSFFLLKEDELWFYAIKFNEKIVSIFEKRN